MYDFSISSGSLAKNTGDRAISPKLDIVDFKGDRNSEICQFSQMSGIALLNKTFEKTDIFDF